MPTLEVARKLASEFEAAYPHTLARQLAWWVKSLGIRESRLIQLIGQASNPTFRTWPQFVSAHRKHAEWVEELLGQLLEQYNYDWEAFATDLKASPILRRSGYSYRFARSSRRAIFAQNHQGVGGGSVLSSEDQSLLDGVYKGGSESLKSLFAFLAKS